MAFNFETKKTEAYWTLSLTFRSINDWYRFHSTSSEQDISSEIYCTPVLFLMQLLEMWGMVQEIHIRISIIVSPAASLWHDAPAAGNVCCNIEAAGRAPYLSYWTVKQQHVRCVLFSSIFISFGCTLDTMITPVSKSFTWCSICKVYKVQVKLFKCPSWHDMPQPALTYRALAKLMQMLRGKKYPYIYCFIWIDVNPGLQLRVQIHFKIRSQAPCWKALCFSSLTSSKCYFLSYTFTFEYLHYCIYALINYRSCINL